MPWLYRAIAVFTLFLVLIGQPVRAEDLPGHFVPANPPGPLPDFVFEDGHGKQLRLQDFHGRPVLLNLWATWCGPCVQEMPSLDRLQNALADKKLVVIALDQERNGADLTAAFFRAHGIGNLGIYSDPSGRTTSVLHVRAMPTSLLIDANGNLNGMVVGGIDWMAPDMIAFLRSRI